MFDITYNANKSFCIVINNKPRDKKNIHPVVINNHTLPYTEKCKYLGHIINNNLTDDDDIASQKICIYTQANALARKFYLCNNSIKKLNLIHTVVQCTPQVFGVILKNRV